MTSLHRWSLITRLAENKRRQQARERFVVYVLVVVAVVWAFLAVQ